MANVVESSTINSEEMCLTILKNVKVCTLCTNVKHVELPKLKNVFAKKA